MKIRMVPINLGKTLTALFEKRLKKELWFTFVKPKHGITSKLS